MGIPVERYSKITDKNNREICLLRAFPCAWGKCTFCDYIEDNGHDEAAMISLNKSILDQVTGEFGVLEVINSGSCFELPKQTLDDIENVIKTKNIRKLFFESHWMYRKHLAAMRSRMQVPIIFKIGVETFDSEVFSIHPVRFKKELMDVFCFYYIFNIIKCLLWKFKAAS